MTIIGREQKTATAPPIASPFEPHNMPSDEQLAGMIDAARKGYEKEVAKFRARHPDANPDADPEVKIAKAILARNESEKKRRQQAGAWSLKD